MIDQSSLQPQQPSTQPATPPVAGSNPTPSVVTPTAQAPSTAVPTVTPLIVSPTQTPVMPASPGPVVPSFTPVVPTAPAQPATVAMPPVSAPVSPISQNTPLPTQPGIQPPLSAAASAPTIAAAQPLAQPATPGVTATAQTAVSSSMPSPVVSAVQPPTQSSVASPSAASPAAKKSPKTFLLVGAGILVLLLGYVIIRSVKISGSLSVKQPNDSESSLTKTNESLSERTEESTLAPEPTTTVALQTSDQGVPLESVPVPPENEVSIELLNQQLLSLPAPAGTSWYICKNVPMALLQPTGWFTLEENGEKGNKACFISREQIIGKDGMFTTGFSVNVNYNISLKTGVSVETYSRKLMEEYANLQQQGMVDTVGKIIELGDSGTAVVTSLAREASKGDHHFYYLNIANTQTDTLYTIVFEGADPTWASDFEQIGKPMLSRVVVLPGI